MHVLRVARAKFQGLLHELTRFGVVGGVAFVVDLGVFNLLRYGLDGEGILHHKPLTARVISVVLATTVAYLGNRHWTWRDRERRALHREYVLFFAFNLAGLLINLGALAFVNYVLGLTDQLSNNVANLVGIGLGSLFRFWAYRRYVFPVVAPGRRRPSTTAQPAPTGQPIPTEQDAPTGQNLSPSASAPSHADLFVQKR